MVTDQGQDQRGIKNTPKPIPHRGGGKIRAVKKGVKTRKKSLDNGTTFGRVSGSINSTRRRPKKQEGNRTPPWTSCPEEKGPERQVSKPQIITSVELKDRE